MGTTEFHTLHCLNPAATYIAAEHTAWTWTYKPKETATGGLVTSCHRLNAGKTVCQLPGKMHVT